MSARRRVVVAGDGDRGRRSDEAGDAGRVGANRGRYDGAAEGHCIGHAKEGCFKDLLRSTVKKIVRTADASYGKPPGR